MGRLNGGEKGGQEGVNNRRLGEEEQKREI